jgi:signal transduction histidine kinase
MITVAAGMFFLLPARGLTLLFGVTLGAIALVSRRLPVTSAWAALATVTVSIALAQANADADWAALAIPTYLLAGIPVFMVTAYAPRWAVIASAVAILAGAFWLGFVPTGAMTNSWVLTIPPTHVYQIASAMGISGREITTVAVLFGLTILAAGLVTRLFLLRRADQDLRVLNEQAQRESQAQLAATAERTRIAREMHDIVAHSLSVIIAQADGGRYAGATDPPSAIRALETIGDTGRAALADMRGILGVLRSEPEDDHARAVPQAVHAADIDALVDQVRATGLDVALARVGERRALPPGIGWALQRICQEALTNALKHAGPGAKVTVMERWSSSTISLDVSDDGRGASAAGDGGGHGLRGMRERAESLGGVFSAGPAPTGGFRLSVTVPLPPLSPNPEGAGARTVSRGEPAPSRDVTGEVAKD